MSLESRKSLKNQNEKNQEMSKHTAVLENEVIDGLNIKANDIVLDCTLGGGGHSKRICELLSKKGILIGLDADKKAITKARKKIDSIKRTCRVVLIQKNFRYLNSALDIALKDEQISKVDKILFDLGLSSDQLNDHSGDLKSGRGFSFLHDEPLKMTFNETVTNDSLTASDIVNNWSEENISIILQNYGEEKFAKRIAGAIIAHRQNKEIKTTYELVEIIKNAVPLSYTTGYTRKKTHFATKTFQALRIAVNDELTALRDALAIGYEHLNLNGRMAVISFHSLEDRIVKNVFRDMVKDNKAIKITKKPIVPSQTEIFNNPRSRSAKLRIVQKTCQNIYTQ